jgi:hypothetical protein
MRADVFYNPPLIVKANLVPVAAVRKREFFLSPNLSSQRELSANLANSFCS